MFECILCTDTIVWIDCQQFSKQIVHTIGINVIGKIRIVIAVLAKTIEQHLLAIVTLLLKICTDGVSIERSILNFLPVSQANAELSQMQWLFDITDAHITAQRYGRTLHHLITKHGYYFSQSIEVITAFEKWIATR